MQQAKITISLECSNATIRSGDKFKNKPGPFLMREFSMQLKVLRKQPENNSQESIAWIADATPICNRTIVDKPISVLMREADEKKIEYECAKNKFPEYYEQINAEARNMFQKGVRAGTLKCIAGCNHCGCKDKILNNNLTDK